MADKPSSIDDYIADFPPDVRDVLDELRRRGHRAIPGAIEAISYGIPAMTLDGRTVVQFAGWKQHVSVYPIPEVDAATEARIAKYRSGRSTLKLPLGQEIPYDDVEHLMTMLAQQRGTTSG
jgi:uncharacterized protein YdhG (YjbR/CyaY superfamily)